MHFRPFLGAALSRANEIFSDGLQGWESLGTFSNEEWVVGSAFKLAWPPLYSAILCYYLEKCFSFLKNLVHFSVLDIFEANVVADIEKVVLSSLGVAVA